MKELKERTAENGMEYVLVSDYYIPCLQLPEETRPIGHWGWQHRQYLKQANPMLLNDLILTGTLWTYLANLNEQAQKRLERIIARLKAAEGITEDTQVSFAPFYTETILNETITPLDIRAVEAQVDQYNFLDIDDIEEFNGYLYQDKRTSKEKARMWALLDQSLQIINRHPELEKLEIRATIKRFLRFYSFLIQATCFESVDLHKKYNFLSYLVKEIKVGSGGNDFDIADKITASNFRQKKTGENTHEIESMPQVNLPTPNEVFVDEAVKKKLSEIIDEINAAYNKTSMLTWLQSLL